MFDRKFRRPPAELARENFPAAGYANRFEQWRQQRNQTAESESGIM